MAAIRRGDHAEIVDNGRMARSKRQCVTVSGLGLIETAGLVVRDRVSDALVEGARHDSRGVWGQTPIDAAASVSVSISASFTAPISSVTFLMPRSSHQAARSSMMVTSAVGLRKPA
jgi:hypothetical protein